MLFCKSLGGQIITTEKVVVNLVHNEVLLEFFSKRRCNWQLRYSSHVADALPDGRVVVATNQASHTAYHIAPSALKPMEQSEAVTLLTATARQVSSILPLRSRAHDSER